MYKNAESLFDRNCDQVNSFETSNKGHGRKETRKLKDKETTHVKYYLSSLENNVEKLAEIIRSHWHIENRLHWSLDVAFAEDKSTVRKGYGS